ncbi:folylpolyglutamate synthase [Coemansia spiralis]|uniref:Folylpolyglutamate synthase n=1 Tax=Coemansia spiralis TaxID=417178 RepID=A0A9W8L596_9FUNG|nr:folylpolyglutamate synthase [Coemansia spiralis]
MTVSEVSASINLGLERIVHFLEHALPEDPRVKLRVVHVAGTNGKGSVCALLAEAAITAGYKVGVFNSPHFLEPNDAIRVQGEAISAAKYAELRAWIVSLDGKAQSPAGPLSPFEVTTVTALWWFAQHEVDLAVVEVGMGGLRDATNVFGLADGTESPFGVGRSLVQCICPVDEDHMGMIGDTIEDIAREKSGIMRPGSWIVIANQERVNAFHTIRHYAHRNSSSHIVNVRRQPCSDSHVSNFSIQHNDDASALASLNIRPPTFAPTWATFNGTGRRCLNVKYPPLLDNYVNTSLSAAASGSEIAPMSKKLNLPLVLPGSFQADNASVAFYALDVLRTYYGYDKLTDAAIQIGFQNVVWPGRLSWLLLDHHATPDAGTPPSVVATNGSVAAATLAPADHKPSSSSRSSTSSNCSGRSGHATDRSSLSDVDTLDSWILADGAHNEPAAAELRRYVDTTLRRFAQQRHVHPPRNSRRLKGTPPVRWIVGFSKGKAMTAILNQLALPRDLLWLVPFSPPSEMPWVSCEATEAIYAAAQKLPCFEQIEVEQFDSLACVLDRLSDDDSDAYMNVLCGSLYLVADLYREMKVRPYDAVPS